MKQKTKYLSKATMSIVLALVLVVSTLAVGIVATNAAYLNGKPNAEANAADVAGDGAVGANAGEPVGASGADYMWVGYKGELNKNDGVTTYSFTMPAGNVSVNAKCRNTAGTITVYFKSATGYVYHPILTVNDGVEQEMTFNPSTDLLTYNGNGDAPYEETGSLRYAWYKKELTGVDTTKEITINIRGKDTYMDATDSYTIAANGSIWLDNLMEGSTLVNLTSESNTQVKDFYESPLHMVATSEEADAIRSASGS